MVSLQSWAKSDIGRKRANNEDSFYQDNQLGLFIVADGMGGHRGGDKASALATKEASTMYETRIKEGCSPTIAIENAMTEAARKVFQEGSTHKELQGMGTTLTIFAYTAQRALIAHIGDTRVYCLRDGLLFQLTNDHSLVSEHVEAGLMSKEEARVSSLRNIITRAIGQGEHVRADFFTFDHQPNDKFLLCTDGLNNMLTDQEISNILISLQSDLAIEALIDHANLAGGDDNITAIIVASR